MEVDIEKRSFAAMLSGPYDHDDAILAIHAGAGGTDLQDWADMLFRMYLRWAEDHGFSTEIIDLTPGEEAGIKKRHNCDRRTLCLWVFAFGKGSASSGASFPV